MAKINDTTLTWFGSQWNKDQMSFAIPAGPDGEDPGLLFLESTNSSGTLQGGLYLWADSSDKLRVGTTKPTDEDASGYALDNTTIGAAANKALSNLASVAVATDFLTATDSTYDLGGTNYWAQSYIDRMYVNSTAYLDGASAGFTTVIGGLTIGSSAGGTNADVKIFLHSASKFMVFDEDADDIIISDATGLILGGDESTSDGLKMEFDGTSTISFSALTSDDALHFGPGAGGNNLDVFFKGATSLTDVTWDASVNTWTFMDDTKCAFGDVDDMYFQFVNAGTLSLLQTSTGVGSLLFGVNDVGIDCTWYSETGGDFMKWTQAGASNLGALVFEDSVIQIDGANVDYTIGISTDALVITGSDHANNNVVFGTHSTTNATDVTFSCASSGDHVKFVGTGTWTFTDVPVTMTGANSSGTLLTVSGIDASTDSDTVVITHRGDGSALKISGTTDTAPTALIELVPAAATTTSVIWVDGDTNGWTGAANIGMVHLANDTALAQVTTSMLLIDNAGKPKASALGFAFKILDSSSATADTYCMEINSTNNEAIKITAGNVLFADAQQLQFGTAAEWKIYNDGTNSITVLGADDWLVGSATTNYTQFAVTSGKLSFAGTAQPTQNVWIPADSFHVFAGSGTLAIPTGCKFKGWNMDASSDESYSTVFYVPEDWNDAAVTCTIYYCTSATSGNTRFDINTSPFAENEDLAVGHTNTDPLTDTLVSATAYDLNAATATTIAANSEWAAGDLIVLNINRDADNTLDTTAADVFLIGVKITYTANQV